MKEFTKLKRLSLCLVLIFWIGTHEKILASDLFKVDIKLQIEEIDISGSVVDSEGEPLIGVNVLIKGTNNGASTDFDGRFTLSDVAENAVLVVSYVGYQTQEVEVDSRAEIDITLSTDAELLEEVIVVGDMGHRKKAMLQALYLQLKLRIYPKGWFHLWIKSWLVKVLE